MGNGTSINSKAPAYEFVDVTKSQRQTMDDVISVLLQKKNGQTKFQLADALKERPKNIDLILNLIKTEGLYNLGVSTTSGKVLYKLSAHAGHPTEYSVNKKNFPKGIIRFGAISNTRMANPFYRDDALKAFYKIMQREGIHTVFHCGDILEGVERKATQGEVLMHGPDAQAEYFAEEYPLVEGIDTYFITAPHHEGTFIDKDMIMIGAYMEATARKSGRTDLHYLGHREVDVHLNVQGEEAIVKLAHVTGNVPYAKSYPMQKYIESLQGGTKPHVVLMGHTGNLETIFYREIWGVQVGSFIDQSPSMRAGRRSTDVGAYIIELHRARDGEEKFHGNQFALTAEDFVFYNSEFYQGNKAYSPKRSK